MTFALAVTWSTPETLLFWINSIGVLLQLLALFLLVKAILQSQQEIKALLNKQSFILWYLAFVGLILKILVQGLVAVPAVAKISYTIHNFVIGFIHLLVLGCLSVFVFGAFLILLSEERRTIISKLGLITFVSGIIISEFLLFMQGIFHWLEMGFITRYYEQIFAASLLLPLGAIILFSSTFVKSTNNQLSYLK
ncbi:MAG: hypothetical protein HKN22_07775 [Bacteroidia bacterium]|nr:hypothetical protein [Bacteroidia bacterium]